MQSERRRLGAREVIGGLRVRTAVASALVAADRLEPRRLFSAVHLIEPADFPAPAVPTSGAAAEFKVGAGNKQVVTNGRATAAGVRLDSATTPLPPLSRTRWTPVGPAPLFDGGNQATSGRVQAVAANPTDPNTLYVAADQGGIWKTTDGGTSWLPLTDGQPTLSMGAVAVSPANPQVVYAGTGGATPGGGILRTADAGATWALLANSYFDSAHVFKLAPDARDPNTLYAAVAFGGADGVWKSTDGGTTWTDTTSAAAAGASFVDVVADPSNPQVLYAAASYSGVENGVYKTTDGGATWSPAGDFPNGGANGRINLAVAPASPRVLYAAVADPDTGGLLAMMKTTDGGATWAALANVPDYMTPQGGDDQTLAVDPGNANVVYAGGGGSSTSIVKTSDGGSTWGNITLGANGVGPHAGHHGIAFDAAGRLLDANDGGVWRLDNPAVGSLQWKDLTGNLAITEFTGVALDPTNPAVAYGGSLGNGVDKFNGSSGWGQLPGAGDGGIVRVDPNNPQTVYEEATGISLGRSDNGGSVLTPKTTGIDPSDPTNLYVPYVIDPANSSRLLLGTNRVYETTNRADNWTAISTPDANGWKSSSPIDALAAAPADGNTVYASTYGHLFVTRNHGATWTDRTPPGGQSNFGDIKVDPANAAVAYAVSGDGGAAGHVWKTSDAGLHWSDVSGNLPALAVHAIALDARGTPASTVALYVGTDRGVYASHDGGASWAPPAAGLPNVEVTSLDLAPRLGVLATGTYGRGMWELLLTPPVAAPVVTGVSVGSSHWAAGFPYAGGYAMPPGAAQLTDLPWTNLDQVSITFDQAVNVTQADLAASGVNAATYATSGFAYNAATFTATWTFAAPLGADRLKLDLAATGPGAVTSAAGGVALDGTFANGSGAFPSGGGTAGTDFVYDLNVLPGDVARKGGPVNILEVIQTRNAQLTKPGDANYSPFYDVDGSGGVNILDVIAVRNRQLSKLPAGTP